MLVNCEAGCVSAEGGSVEKNLRKRHVWWRPPKRIRTSTLNLQGYTSTTFCDLDFNIVGVVSELSDDMFRQRFPGIP